MSLKVAMWDLHVVYCTMSPISEVRKGCSPGVQDNSIKISRTPQRPLFPWNWKQTACSAHSHAALLRLRSCRCVQRRSKRGPLRTIIVIFMSWTARWTQHAWRLKGYKLVRRAGSAFILLLTAQERIPIPKRDGRIGLRGSRRESQFPWPRGVSGVSGVPMFGCSQRVITTSEACYLPLVAAQSSSTERCPTVDATAHRSRGHCLSGICMHWGPLRKASSSAVSRHVGSIAWPSCRSSQSHNVRSDTTFFR